MAESARLVAVNAGTAEIGHMQRLLTSPRLQCLNQISHPDTKHRAVLRLIKAGAAGSHGNQQTIQSIQKGRICPWLTGPVDAWMIHQLTQLTQPRRIGDRSGELETLTAQMSGDSCTDIATTDNSETKSHGVASTVYTT